jgi:hypothetical protein
LAWESCRNKVNQSSILGAVEGLDIVPDGRVIKESVSDPGLDDSLAISVPLDIGNRVEVGVRVGESETEAESPVSAETVEDGIYTHVMVSP